MPNIFDQFDTPSVAPQGTNPFDAFDGNFFDQFGNALPPKFANLPGSIKLDPLQQAQMQSLSAGKGIDPENAGATIANLLRGNDDVFLQSVAPPIVAAAHTLTDNPLTRKIGFGLNFAGQAIKGDVESALFSLVGQNELANQQLIATAASMDPAWKQKDESLGIDTSDPYEDARETLPVAERMVSGIGPGLLQSAPQLALSAVQPELGAASFGFTPQGFDPVQAAAMMIAPAGGKLIGGIVEKLAVKTGISDAQALDVINRLGGGTGVAGLISAPTAWQIAQMKPGPDRDEAIQDAASNAILTGVLGSVGARNGSERPNVEMEGSPENAVPTSSTANVSSMQPLEKSISQKIDDLSAALKDIKDTLTANQILTKPSQLAQGARVLPAPGLGEVESIPQQPQWAQVDPSREWGTYDLRKIPVGSDPIALSQTFPKSETPITPQELPKTADGLRLWAKNQLAKLPNTVFSPWGKEVVLYRGNDVAARASQYISGGADIGSSRDRAQTLPMLANTIRNAMTYASVRGSRRSAYLYRYAGGQLHVVIVDNDRGTVEKQFVARQYPRDPNLSTGSDLRVFYRNGIEGETGGELPAGNDSRENGGAAVPVVNKAKPANGSQIPTIRGRRPINSKYAGQVHPSGVRFTSRGFPDFSPYAIAELEIDGLTGYYTRDEALANKASDLKKTPKAYVWHHVEDGKAMQLIPRKIHKLRHTGGAAVIRNGGFDK